MVRHVRRERGAGDGARSFGGCAGAARGGGLEIIAHVHDEAIAEIPEGEDRQAEFLAIMTQAPPWADGLPIAGKAWRGQRCHLAVA